MIKTTRAQREALFRVFQRSFPSWVTPTLRLAEPVRTVLNPSIKEWMTIAERNPKLIVKVPSIQYRRFLKTTQPAFGDSCVMVPYAGMWLGIETDGYTHS